MYYAISLKIPPFYQFQPRHFWANNSEKQSDVGRLLYVIFRRLPTSPPKCSFHVRCMQIQTFFGRDTWNKSIIGTLTLKFDSSCGISIRTTYRVTNFKLTIFKRQSMNMSKNTSSNLINNVLCASWLLLQSNLVQKRFKITCIDMGHPVTHLQFTTVH